MKTIHFRGRWLSPTFVALGLLGLIMLHVWRPGAVIMQGDSVYFPDPFTQLKTSFLSWNHVSALAGSYSQTVCYTLLLAISGSIQKLLGYSFSQIVILWLLIAGAWIGAFRLARRFQASPFAAFVSAWLYAINPWAQQFYAYNYQLQVLIVCVPFIVMWLLDAALAGRRTAATFVLRFALFAALPASVFGINPALLALTIFVIVPFIPFAMMIQGRVRPLLLACSAALPVAVIAAGWWLIPTAWADLHSAVTAQLSPDAWSWVTAHSSFLDNFRFEPTWWWKASYVPYCDLIDGNILLYGSQFIAISLLLVGLTAERNDQRRAIIVYSGIWIVLALFVSKGYHEPFAWLNEAFFKLPGAFFFREPTTKAPLLALAMLILPVAFAIDILIRAVVRKFTARATRVLQAVVLAAAFAAGYPTISGVVFHDVTDEVPGLYARLPDYWRTMAAKLNADPHTGGVLMLPFEDFYQVNYGWFYGADSIADWLLTRPVVHLGDAGYAYTESPVQQSLERQLARAIIARDPHVPELCRALGIRYILYRGDVTVAPELRVTLDDVRRVIGRRPIERFGQLAVVALDNNLDSTKLAPQVRYNDGHDAGLLSMLAATDRTTRIWPVPPGGLVPATQYERTRPPISAQERTHVVSGIVATDVPVSGKIAAGGIAWHVSRNDESPKTISMTHDVFSARPLADGYPIPDILEQHYTESGRHRTFRIFSPAANTVAMNLRLTVHANTRMEYTAHIDGKSTRTIIDPLSNVDWIGFSNVRIPAGQSTLTVDWQPTSVPPTSKAEIDSGGTFLGVLQFQPLSTGKAPAIAFSRQMDLATESDHALSGTVAIEQTLQNSPNMYLGIGMGSFIAFGGVVFDVERDGRRYLIYAHSYASNIVLESRKIIQLAFERAHIPLRRSEFSAITVHSVGVDAAFFRGPNTGNPGIVALTVAEKLLDRNSHMVAASAPEPYVHRNETRATSTLRGQPLFTLTGLNMTGRSSAVAEVYSLQATPVQTTMRIHDSNGHESASRVEIKPGFSYVELNASEPIAEAIRSGNVGVNFAEPTAATVALQAQNGSQGRIRPDGLATLVHYRSIRRSLATIPALWLLGDADNSAPGIYWGVVWDITWHAKRYVAYQHEFLSGQTLDPIPAILRILTQNVHVPNIRPEDVFVNGVSAAAALAPGKSGLVRIAEFDTAAAPQDDMSSTQPWSFRLPAPLAGSGNFEITLCGKDNGPLSFDLLDSRGTIIARRAVTSGILSELSEARPKIGITYAVRTAIHSLRVRVPLHTAPAANGGAPCTPELRFATDTRFANPLLSIGTRRYELAGSAGSIRGSGSTVGETASSVSVDPGSAKTAFVAVAPIALTPNTAPIALPLRALAAGMYALSPSEQQGRGVIALPESFDPLWMAIGARPGQPLHFLPHTKVNGWANGYLLSGETFILAYNGLNLLQILASAVSLGVIVFAWLRLRRYAQTGGRA